MGKNRKIQRPSDRFRYPLDISRFEAIRDAQLSLPISLVDVEIVDACNRVLCDSVEVGIEEIEYEWNRLKKRIEMEQKQVSRKRLSLILAALIILTMCGVAIASGMIPWELHLGWNEHGFEFFFIRHESTGMDSESKQEFSFDEDFERILAENQVDVPLPSWMPERFSYAGTDVLPIDDGWIKLSAFFRSEDGTERLIIEIDILKDDKGSSIANLEREGMYETIHQNDQDYYLFSNLERVTVYWITPPCTVSISGDLTRDEALRVIQSILGG